MDSGLLQPGPCLLLLLPPLLLRLLLPLGRPKGNSGPRSTDAIAPESCTFLPRFFSLFFKFL